MPESGQYRLIGRNENKTGFYFHFLRTDGRAHDFSINFTQIRLAASNIRHFSKRCAFDPRRSISIPVDKAVYGADTFRKPDENVTAS